MSIYSEIDRLELAKQNLKLKLESKGVTVPANARISDYAALINLLPEIKESEFTNRIVDNGNSGTGKAKIYNIKGKTLAWNQFTNNYRLLSNIASEVKVSGKTLTLLVTSTLTTAAYFSNYGISSWGEHKYYVSFQVTPSVNCDIRYSTKGYYSDSNYITKSLEAGKINTCSRISDRLYGYIWFGIWNAEVNATITFSDLNVVDLTLLYSSEIDNLTDEQILAKYESDFGTGYHEYNAGTLISNDAQSLETVGFNQWDEEWEAGRYNEETGEKINTQTALASFIRTKNYICVFPSTQYYIKKSAGILCRIIEYDVNGNYVRYQSPQTSGSGTIFTTDATTGYIGFYLQQTTYNNDICLNLSNPAKNGTYEAYKKVICNLNLNSFRVKDSENNIITVNGLKSAGSVYDEIVGNKYIKRIGEVDLGTLSWGYNEGTGYKFVTNNIFPRSKLNASMICTLYELYSNIPYSSKRTDIDKKIGICTSSNNYWGIYVIDSSYTDNSTFKTAMSGVMLYYELATPIEYELVDEIDTIYDVDKDGVERIISPVHADGSPSAPFRASIGYPVDQEQ